MTAELPPPPVAPARPKEFVYYGVPVSMALAPVMRELKFFRMAPEFASRRHPSYTGEGRLHHALSALHLLFGRNYEMHEWAHDCLDLFCSYSRCAVTGPKGAGKTTAAAVYAFLFWLSSPNDTGVLVCSPSAKTLKRGMWKEMKKFFRLAQAVAPEANLADYKMAIQATKNDDAHGIFGIQVAQGQTERALSRMIGFHPKNLLIIVDEATDTPEAIDDACANLDMVAGEFQIIRLGNAASRFDSHGKACEPARGWKSITVEDEFWETRDGACLHLDGTKSPNIKLGKRKFPYLIDQRKMDADAKALGENSPKFWRFNRGFWAPDGLENTVITETMAVKFDVREKAEWMREPTPCAGLDPAFGGDRCILTIGRFGKCRDRRTRLEFSGAVPIKLNADSKEPIDYQIARQARDACRERGISPRHFGLDATGTGRGVAAILRREWSPQIQVVEFGGSATDRPVSQDNPKRCDEEYDRFVTELWFSFRVFVECDQIRGLEEEALKEFCTRQYEVRGRGLYRIETKEEMKERTGGVSPDCFIAGTLVSTYAGLKPIEQVEEGETVLTPMGYSPVVKLHRHLVTNLVRVSFSTGRELTGTGKHEIFIWKYGWKRLDAASVGNEAESIQAYPRWNILNAFFTPVEPSEFKRAVGIIKTRTGVKHRRDFFTGASGLTTMELFLTAWQSIIKMMTGLITGLKILNSWSCASTRECTLYAGCTRQREEEGPCLALRRQERLQKHGTLLQKVGHGIANTPLKSQPTDLNFQSSAFSVESFSPQRWNENSVQTDARFEPAPRRKFSAFAWYALRYLWRLVIPAPRPVVQGVQLISDTAPVPVFNLTLQSENAYYANGILVANCADSVSVLVEVCRRNGMIAEATEGAETKDRQAEEAEQHRQAAQFDFDSADDLYLDASL